MSRDVACSCGRSPCYVIADCGPLCELCERRLCVRYDLPGDPSLDTVCEVDGPPTLPSPGKEQTCPMHLS